MNCEDCGSEVWGNVCENCGLVVEDHPISYDFGIYEFGDERKEPERPLTVLSWDDPDIGIKTYHSNKTTNKRLKHAFKTEKRTQPNLIFGRWESKRGEGYLNAHNEIRRLCNILKLSKNIQNDAIWILRNLTIKEFIQKSYKKYASYAGIIMVAARNYNRFPLEFSKIGLYSDETSKKIREAYKNIKKELEIEPNPFKLEEIVNYHCNLLGVFNAKKRECIRFAEKIKVEGNLFGYSAAVIRIITRRTRKEISKVLKVSEPTITKNERELRKL